MGWDWVQDGYRNRMISTHTHRQRYRQRHTNQRFNAA